MCIHLFLAVFSCSLRRGATDDDTDVDKKDCSADAMQTDVLSLQSLLKVPRDR